MSGYVYVLPAVPHPDPVTRLRFTKMSHGRRGRDKEGMRGKWGGDEKRGTEVRWRDELHQSEIRPKLLGLPNKICTGYGPGSIKRPSGHTIVTPTPKCSLFFLG